MKFLLGLVEEQKNFVQPVQNDDRNHLSWKCFKKDILRETMSLHLSEIGKKSETIMGTPGFGACYCFTLILPPVIGKVIMTALVVLGYT